MFRAENDSSTRYLFSDQLFVLRYNIVMLF